MRGRPTLTTRAREAALGFRIDVCCMLPLCSAALDRAVEALSVTGYEMQLGWKTPPEHRCKDGSPMHHQENHSFDFFSNARP